jgi:hypothetical protein
MRCYYLPRPHSQPVWFPPSFVCLPSSFFVVPLVSKGLCVVQRHHSLRRPATVHNRHDLCVTHAHPCPLVVLPKPSILHQDCVLCNDTIRYNIRYGRNSATDAEVASCTWMHTSQVTLMCEPHLHGDGCASLTLPAPLLSCACPFQDCVLFNDTIRYNIRYGRNYATDAEVEEAAEAACIHETISTRFPKVILSPYAHHVWGGGLQ